MDSQAIVNTMEILETKPLSDLVTEATVKVCYVSETPNNNGTVITKEVGREIAATLPGAPVVGFFDETSEDFAEHSRRLVMKQGEIEWKELTKPYGFVSPLDKPWYQDFLEDGVQRTYLMCKAYLWTRQYKEASLIPGKSQSMELSESDMSGYYEGDVFIFTHTTLDKLCVLGDKYAPCFEGAQFMTTYSKVYNNFAKEVENILGRRYYVLNDKLVEKPEKITLTYAIELGWNLEEAVYHQLVARGAQEKYGIKGIFTENGNDFVILQDRETLAYLKVDLYITDQDTVELGASMIEVIMTWVPKPPQTTTLEPIEEGGTVVATETPATNTSTMTETNTYAEKVDEVEIPTESGIENQSTVVEENQSEVPVEPEVATPEEGEQIVEKGIEEASKEIGDAETPTTVDNSSEKEQVDTDPGVETTPEETGNGENQNSEEPTDDDPAEDNAAGEEGGATDYVAINQELTDRVNFLQQEIASKDDEISQLNEQLNVYKKKEAEEIEAQKQVLVTSFSALLTEEEMKPVTDKLSELSLMEVEDKLSVTYARKQRSAEPQSNSYQLNISSVETEDVDLPEYMKQALKYDADHALNI